MKKTFILFPLLLIVLSSFGQSTKVSLSAHVQYQQTVLDRAITNNAYGAGLSLTGHLRGKRKVVPQVEVEANRFFGDNRLYPNGRYIFQAKDEVYNLFAGAAYPFSTRIEAAMGIGASYFNAAIFPVLKPTISYSLSKKKRWDMKASWVIILQKNEGTHWPFSYVSMGVGTKLF